MQQLRVGTDCSGIEAPIQALQQLNIPFIHEFACEKDKYALQSIQANYNPKLIYTDITTRDHSSLPDIDLYVCGFPCQPFSNIGKKLGILDPRSNISEHCVEVIRVKQPKFFILENVKNFKTIQDGIPFNHLLQELNVLDYSISVDILNTKDYGIPQNRERLFFIGIRKDIDKSYVTPEKKEMNSLDSYIEDKTICDLSPNKAGLKIIEKNKLHDTNSLVSCVNFGTFMVNLSPSLTTTHPHYHTKYNRYLTPRECLNLQGFKDFTQVVSNTQIYRQIGNSMSVNVIKEIITQFI
jgi:DNA (cytosine-5)-methyltransferase 1